MVPDAAAGRPVLLAYDAALIALAVGLLVALLLASWERTPVTDLVVELAADRTRSIESSLARALGDHTLQVGYWIGDHGGYVDATGRPVNLPDPNSGRAVTPVEWEGARIGQTHSMIPPQPPARPLASQYRRRRRSQQPTPACKRKSATRLRRYWHRGADWLRRAPTNAEDSSAEWTRVPAANLRS